MSFEKHLFISYAHIDNEPLTPEQQGWVSRFHASLRALLSMRLGRPAEIWRDDKLKGTDIFGDEIVSQFPKTAMLISVLTPRYVESEWCTKEVRKFCEAADQTGGLVVDNQCRIVKVIKTPVDSEDPLPPVMKELLGYEFYVFDEGHAPLELDPAYGPDIAQKFNLKLAKLAWEIKLLLDRLSPVGSAGPVVTGAPKPVVYLAECSKDRQEDRETLETDLKRQGYTVFPDRQLPWKEADYLSEVARILERCKLSIHLVGSLYQPLDGEKSIAALQNEIAIQRSHSAGLRRVIWVPEGTKSQHEEEQRFIDSLHNDKEAQFGAEGDLVTADLETLKSVIHEALQNLEKPEPPKVPADQEGPAAKTVYLICDERDRKATIPLRKFLKSRALDAKIPLFDGDAGVVRQANQELLTVCDAILLFYGAGDEAWKHTVESEFTKMKGYRAGKALTANYTYLAAPSTGAKQDLVDMEDPDLIDGRGDFLEAALEPFIKAVNGA